MKETDTPEISSAWWKKNQPTTLPATGLGEALRTYEAARAKAQPTDDVAAMTDRLKEYDTALEALDGVGTAVAKAQGKCNKVLHATCLKVLSKYGTVLTKEKSAVTKEKERLAAALEKAKSDMREAATRILSNVVNEVKASEKLLKRIEDIALEAEDLRDSVARAVVDNEPNAGEVEEAAIGGYLRDARSLAKELSSQASQAQKATQKAWDEAIDQKTRKADPHLSRVYDKLETLAPSFELAETKARKAVDSIAEALDEVRDMANGQGDLEAQFLKTCLGLENRTQKVMGNVRAFFAEAGGAFEKTKFNVMNFKDAQHEDYRKAPVLEEARESLKRGLLALNTGKSELTKGRSGFDRVMTTLPPFATRDNQKFRDVLDALDKAMEIYDGYGRELKKLSQDAEKVAESFKSAL